MKKLIIAVGLTFAACKNNCYQWNEVIPQDGLHTCNLARADVNYDYLAQSNFDDCVRSFGYYAVEVSCK